MEEMGIYLGSLAFHAPSLGEIADFLKKYGYIVLFFGVLLEGETIVVISGALARVGTLYLPWVMLTAWIGSVINDQGLFLIGHHYGPSVFKRWPHLGKKVEPSRRLIQRYGDAVVMLFRFVYGTRTVTPLLLGANRYSWRRFALLNIPAAFIWAVLISTLGYFLGASIKILLADIRHVEMAILGIVVIVAAYLFWRYKRMG